MSLSFASVQEQGKHNNPKENTATRIRLPREQWRLSSDCLESSGVSYLMRVQRRPLQIARGDRNQTHCFHCKKRDVSSARYTSVPLTLFADLDELRVLLLPGPLSQQQDGAVLHFIWDEVTIPLYIQRKQPITWRDRSSNRRKSTMF